MTDFNTTIHGNVARWLREWKLMEDSQNKDNPVGRAAEDVTYFTLEMIKGLDLPINSTEAARERVIASLSCN